MLKGPSAMAYGNGAAGGIVNEGSKAPRSGNCSFYSCYYGDPRTVALTLTAAF